MKLFRRFIYGFAAEGFWRKRTLMVIKQLRMLAICPGLASPLFVLALTTGAAEAAPVRDVWVQYQAMLYDTRSEAGGGSVWNESHGHGYVPSFRIRLRGPAGQEPAMDIIPAGHPQPFVNRHAALLLDLAALELPAARSSPWFEYYRGNSAWEWRHERIRAGARHLAVEFELSSEPTSPGARICRFLEIEPLAGADRDTCLIQAIIDQDDDWPIVTEVTRTRTAPNGGRAAASLTFERLEGRQASP